MAKACSNCDGSPVVALGYCRKCYGRWHRHGDPTITLTDASRPPGSPCSECGKPAVAKGYCKNHWRKWKQYGDPNFVARPPQAEFCSSCKGPTLGRGAKGLCGKCYQRKRKYGDASDSVLRFHPRGPTCANCGKPTSPSSARGYCDSCYKRWQKYGDPNESRPPSPPPIIRKYTLNHDYFEDISTPEQAYWLGFIAADGAVIRNGKSYILRLELSKTDAEHVQMFTRALGSDAPVRDSRTFAYVALNSRQMVESLERIGIGPRKSVTVKPWDGPLDLMPHYWRGLFDGDGCIHRAKRRSTSWTLTQVGSQACVNGFTKWAASVCGTKTTPRHITGGCWQVAIGGSYMPQELATALYGDAPVALARKLKLATELIATDFRAMHGRRSGPRRR